MLTDGGLMKTYLLSDEDLSTAGEVSNLAFHAYTTFQKETSAMYIILVYDIQVERVAKVCKYLRQHLNWIQNSVFEGQLTKAQLARVKSGLAALTDPEHDSIIIYQLRDARWMNKEVMGIDKNPATNLL